MPSSLLRSWTGLWPAILVFLALGCDVVREPCDASVADCACVVDEDCVLTKYHSDVPKPGDCYGLDYCCPVDAHVVNYEAAMRNEDSWEAMDCAYDLDGGTCGDCDPGDAVWVECRSGGCVKFHQPATAPSQLIH